MAALNAKKAGIKGAIRAGGGSVTDMLLPTFDQLVKDPEYDIRTKDDEYWAWVRELSLNIERNGIETPLKGFPRGDKLVVVMGNTRYDALALMRSEGRAIPDTIPFVQERKTTNDADRNLSIVTGNTFRPLRPIEVALVLKRQVNFGWSNEKIATHLGKSAQWVRDMVVLASAPEAVQERVRKGEVAATAAIGVVREHGEAAAEVIAEGVARAKKAGKEHASTKHFAPQADDSEKRLQRVCRRHGPTLHAMLTELLNAKRKGPIESAARELLQQIDEEVGASAGSGGGEDEAPAALAASSG